MSWSGDLRQMVLEEFADVARRRGAKTPDDASTHVGAKPPIVIRKQRRIIQPRSANAH